MRQIPVIHNLPPHVFRYLLPPLNVLQRIHASRSSLSHELRVPVRPRAEQGIIHRLVPLVVIAHVHPRSLHLSTRRDARSRPSLAARSVATVRSVAASQRLDRGTSSIARFGPIGPIDRWRNIDRSIVDIDALTFSLSKDAMDVRRRRGDDGRRRSARRADEEIDRFLSRDFFGRRRASVEATRRGGREDDEGRDEDESSRRSSTVGDTIRREGRWSAR